MAMAAEGAGTEFVQVTVLLSYVTAQLNTIFDAALISHLSSFREMHSSCILLGTWSRDIMVEGLSSVCGMTRLIQVTYSNGSAVREETSWEWTTPPQLPLGSIRRV